MSSWSLFKSLQFKDYFDCGGDQNDASLVLIKIGILIVHINTYNDSPLSSLAMKNSLMIIMAHSTFTLKSSDVGGQATPKQGFNGGDCAGADISPALSWANAPEGTTTSAITIIDPAAPSGSGWWHWLIFDIPSSISELASDAGNVSKGLAPKGSIQSLNDFGMHGYGGPCPPVGHGPHPYIITVHALNVEKLG